MDIKKLILCTGLLASCLNTVAYTAGNVSYEKFQRLNTPEEQTSYNDWAGINVNHTGTSFNAKTHGEVDLRFYINNDNELNFSVPESYIEWKNRDQRLSIGRQILNWNENEKYWLLNTINANQGFYLLGEKKEGLTGVQYEHRIHKNYAVSFFFSYLHIPSLNPGVEINSGQISSKSEWVRLPPSATTLNIGGQDRLVPLYFEMNQGKISDYILKKSIGARQAYSWDKGRSELSSYAIYKPESSIRLNAEAYMDESLEQIRVVANPVVNHHLVYGLQYKQRLGNVQWTTGLDYSDPNARLGKDFRVLDLGTLKENDQVFESQYFTVKPNYEKESYLHTSFNLNKGKYMLSLNYIHNLTDNKRGSDDFYSEAVKWKKTIGSRARYYIDDFFNVMVDLKYDFERKDTILKAEANYQMFNKASFNVGMELIRSPIDNSYWAAYRANDAVYSSLKFLF